MKSLLVYSSRTGNTEKVARAIFEVLPEPREIYPVETAPPAEGYDFVALGFWVDKGRPDERASRYMATVRDQVVGLFGTLGAEPDSEHARTCIRRAMEMMSERNRVAGALLCQGRVDPAVVAAMQRHAPNTHPMTPERRARLREAEKHPDETDLRNAQRIFARIIEGLREGWPEKEAACAR
ncbi:MAG: flavodoxin family protein [Desulfococcaceae bacterium]